MKPTPASQPSTRQLLTLGLAQAAGFVVGGLLGYALGQATGMDAMDPAGYTTTAMVGLLLIGLGSGAWLVAGPWLWGRLRKQINAARAEWGTRVAGGLLCAVAAGALWMDLVYRPSLWCR